MPPVGTFDVVLSRRDSRGKVFAYKNLEGILCYSQYWPFNYRVSSIGPIELKMVTWLLTEILTIPQCKY